MPFRHPDRSHDLDTRIEHEVRERLEEAIDFVCLEALVKARQARGLPAPAADNTADRAEYTQNVLAFLRLLQAEIPPPDPTCRAGGGDEQQRLLAAQVAYARRLPDYWQRFEALSARFLAEPSGGVGGRPEPPTSSSSEGRGLLARLFGRR
jgi:hypothetical protein